MLPNPDGSLQSKEEITERRTLTALSQDLWSTREICNYSSIQLASHLLSNFYVWSTESGATCTEIWIWCPLAWLKMEAIMTVSSTLSKPLLYFLLYTKGIITEIKNWPGRKTKWEFGSCKLYPSTFILNLRCYFLMWYSFHSAWKRDLVIL
jgi:hypothetical protein